MVRARVGVAVIVVAAVIVALAGCTPAGARDITGDLLAHDPALVAGDDGEPWFVYSTGDPLVDGGELQVRRSDDAGVTWRYAGVAWPRAEPET